MLISKYDGNLNISTTLCIGLNVRKYKISIKSKKSKIYKIVTVMELSIRHYTSPNWIFTEKIKKRNYLNIILNFLFLKMNIFKTLFVVSTLSILEIILDKFILSNNINQ